MKKVKLTLSLCAVILGSVFAFAGTTKFQAETVYLGNDNQWHNIPSTKKVLCDNAQRFCTGTGTIANPQPTSRRGFPTLVDK